MVSRIRCFLVSLFFYNHVYFNISCKSTKGSLIYRALRCLQSLLKNTFKRTKQKEKEHAVIVNMTVGHSNKTIGQNETT